MYSPAYSSTSLLFSGSSNNELHSQLMSPFSNFDDSNNNQLQPAYRLGADSPTSQMYEHSRTQDQLPSRSPSYYGQHSQHPMTSNSRFSGRSLGQLLVSEPAVQDLWNDLAEANRRIARALDSRTQMEQELLRLSSMIQPDSERGRSYVESRFRWVQLLLSGQVHHCWQFVVSTLFRNNNRLSVLSYYNSKQALLTEFIPTVQAIQAGHAPHHWHQVMSHHKGHFKHRF